jgi:hypothetical protein
MSQFVARELPELVMLEIIDFKNASECNID